MRLRNALALTATTAALTSAPAVIPPALAAPAPLAAAVAAPAGPAAPAPLAPPLAAPGFAPPVAAVRPRAAAAVAPAAPAAPGFTAPPLAAPAVFAGPPFAAPGFTAPPFVAPAAFAAPPLAAPGSSAASAGGVAGGNAVRSMAPWALGGPPSLAAAHGSSAASARSIPGAGLVGSVVQGVPVGNPSTAGARGGPGAGVVDRSTHGGPGVARQLLGVSGDPFARSTPRVDDRPEEPVGEVVPADQQPTCGNAADPDFPIRTRMHGGPRTVHPGAGFQSVGLDLTNTTEELCHRIHPVVVLTGRPGLAADKVTVEFRDEDAGRWRPVSLERTSEDEIVGAFDDGFRGFVVPAGKTLTVKVRLALAAGTAPNTVTVNAAVVQRKGNDGDWVGASGDYRFDVTEAPEDSALARSLDELATTGTGTVARLAAAGAVTAVATGLLVLMFRRIGARRR
ncbi:hypothetical protein [Streptomyces sp. NPDC018833]|uniref:hypothetical protein n=1 Tax=Streptomyces sp. NPDC018833 TaxID=3365053 RepID=UPI0037917EAC